MNYNNQRIFISGNVPSSKNSRIWTGRYSVVSKTVKKYITNSKDQWMENREKFISQLPIDTNNNVIYPIYVEFQFIRGSRHQFDYINPAQTVQDLMTKYEWIPDDNSDILIPSFKPYVYDKGNPGVFIHILIN